MREDAGLTQSELAIRCECSKHHLGNVERGKVVAGVELLRAIKHATGASEREVMRRYKVGRMTYIKQELARARELPEHF